MKVYTSLGEFKGNKRVFIAIPTFGDLSAGTVSGLFGGKEALLANGIDSELRILAGNCHVDDSRNRLVRDFLDTDCDEFVFIDADIRFDPLDLVSLVNHDRDVVAGIYPLKSDDVDYPVQFLGDEIWSDKDGLIEVSAVPTGFLKIKRHVLEALYEQAPKFVAKTDKPTQKRTPVIFERTIAENTRWGGDYEFCRKWKALGGKIYVDPEMSFGHIGPKEYDGSLGKWLREKNGLSEPFIRSITQKIFEGSYTVKDIYLLSEEWGNEWSAPANELCALAQLVEACKGNILEVGSGISTLVIDPIAQRKGLSFDSIESDAEWAQRTRKFTSDCIIECEIVDNWYDFTPNRNYSLVFIDGPVRKYGRSGIVKIKDHFADDCVFIMDDVDTELGVMKELEALGYKFQTFGRYAIGK